jgi:hypothetical protein
MNGDWLVDQSVNNCVTVVAVFVVCAWSFGSTCHAGHLFQRFRASTRQAAASRTNLSTDKNRRFRYDYVSRRIYVTCIL